MLRTEIKGEKLVAFLEGRIDSTNARALQEALEAARNENAGRELELDAGALGYISSAGLRVLLQLRKAQDVLTVRNVSPEVYDILDMTGFTKMLDVKKKLREVSVEGCEIVGRGAIGTVYRVDEDTIVKVYEIPDSLPMIENEQKRAKQAFLRGIPTAISYDVVKVGEKLGSVFEMLKATTYNDILKAHPERQAAIIRQFAGFVRQFHAVEMERGELPEAKTVYMGYLDALKGVMPEPMRKRLRALFETMPENLHAVHGDIQMNNVMLSGDEPLLIDMDTLCTGDPVFDLAGLYMAYVQFSKDDPGNAPAFFGITDEMAASVWNGVLRNYFDGLDGAALAEVEKRTVAVTQVRFLFLIAVLGIGKPELRQMRVDHALACLEELLPQVDSLEIGGFIED